MAWTWAVNAANNDIFINASGKLQTVYGAEEVRQRILIALQHHWEEYFLNVQDGVPWEEIILGSKDKRTVDMLLRRSVLDVPGVISLISYQSVFNTGVRSITFYMVAEVNGLAGPQTLEIIETLSMGA